MRASALYFSIHDLSMYSTEDVHPDLLWQLSSPFSSSALINVSLSSNQR